MAGAVGLVLAACAPDDEPSTDPSPGLEQPDEPDDELEDGFDDATEGDAADDLDVEEPGDPDPTDDTANGDQGDPEASTDDEVAALDGDATTEMGEREPVDAQLVVTDVRVGAHAGFDRVTFEFEGEGEAGWFTELTAEPTSQGSGEPIDFAGGHALWVAVSTVTLPGDEPEGVAEHARLDVDVRVDGPEDGVITEVVGDTLFEGLQTFAIGLDEERAYRIDRLSDPERVVIDILHD